MAQTWNVDALDPFYAELGSNVWNVNALDPLYAEKRLKNTLQSQDRIALNERAFDNNVGKRQNTVIKHFLLFLHCFLLHQKQVCRTTETCL